MTITIEQWMQDCYGLTLHTDHDDVPLYVPTAAMLAAAHAAGFTTALDRTDEVLAAQLTGTRRGSIDPSVRLLAAARDLAWHSITAVAARAQHAGLASLPTGANRAWKPVCVVAPTIGPKAYPALAHRRPDAPPRFTRTATERIRDDLAHQSDHRVTFTFDGPVLTVSHGEHARIRPTRHEPDDDGLYYVGAGSLIWKRADQHEVTR